MEAAAADPSQLFSKRFVRRLVLPLTLAALAYAGLLFYGDASLIGAALGSLSPGALLMGLGLSLVSFGLRGIRWLWYLRFLGIRVPLGTSLLVFVTGLGMSITPGKAGELLKSLLLKEKLDIPVANTVPIVIAERLTDLFAMVALAAGGLGWLWSPWIGVAALLGCLGVFFFLGKSQRLVWSVVSAVTRLLKLDRYHDKLETAFRVLWQLWEPRAYVTPMLLALSAWALQAIIIVVFTMSWPAGAVSIPSAIVAYTAPLLAGTLLLLPGGVGLTEASMTGVLEALCGMARAEAAALTILVRLTTFWLAVVLGFSTLAAWRPWDASRRAPASTR